jgi:signal transduction histidine kinase
VWADREKLAQVLVNLLSNAGKFTPAGGRVTVGMATDLEDPTLVALEVRDTGIGIPPEKLASIFEPFVQVRSDLTRPNEGTGWAWPISRDSCAAWAAT